jgi:cytochrome c peroxidase
MHDGRFNTLEEVVEFYNSGIQPHDQLSFSLRQGWNGGIDVFEGDETPVNNTEVNPLRLNLSQDQKSALVAFLKTLSDEQLISDEKFSNPFIH